MSAKKLPLNRLKGRSGGVYFHKPSNRWRVIWLLGGKQKEEYFSSEKTARDEAKRIGEHLDKMNDDSSITWADQRGAKIVFDQSKAENTGDVVDPHIRCIEDIYKYKIKVGPKGVPTPESIIVLGWELFKLTALNSPPSEYKNILRSYSPMISAWRPYIETVEIVTDIEELKRTFKDLTDFTNKNAELTELAHNDFKAEDLHNSAFESDDDSSQNTDGQPEG